MNLFDPAAHVGRLGKGRAVQAIQFAFVAPDHPIEHIAAAHEIHALGAGLRTGFPFAKAGFGVFANALTIVAGLAVLARAARPAATVRAADLAGALRNAGTIAVADEVSVRVGFRGIRAGVEADLVGLDVVPPALGVGRFFVRTFDAIQQAVLAPHGPGLLVAAPFEGQVFGTHAGTRLQPSETRGRIAQNAFVGLADLAVRTGPATAATTIIPADLAVALRNTGAFAREKPVRVRVVSAAEVSGFGIDPAAIAVGVFLRRAIHAEELSSRAPHGTPGLVATPFPA